MNSSTLAASTVRRRADIASGDAIAAVPCGALFVAEGFRQEVR